MASWRALFSERRRATSHPETHSPRHTPPATNSPIPKAEPDPIPKPLSGDKTKTIAASEASSSLTGTDQHQPSPSRIPDAEDKTNKASTTVLNGLKVALGLLKEAVTGIQVPGLEPAVSGVVKVVEIIESVKNNKEDLKDLSHRISRITAVITESPNLRSKDEVPEAELQGLLNMVMVILSEQNLVLRTANNKANRDEIAKINTSIDQMIARFSAEGIISLELDVAEARVDIREVGRTAEDVRQTVDVVHKKTDGVRKMVDSVYQMLFAIYQLLFGVYQLLYGVYQLLFGVYQLLFGVDRKVDGILKAQIAHRQNVDIVHTKMDGVDQKLDGVGQKVDGVDQKVDSVQEAQTIQEYEALIEKIPRVHARYHNTSRKPSSPCHPGTRADLLQGINTWIEAGSDAAPYLWLCGEVGVGKTTVAHTIAKEQDGLEQLGASFFFSRHDPDRQAPHLLFPSIAYQLARFDRGVWKALAEVLKPDPDIVNRSLTEQFTKLILEPLARSGMATSQTVVIVIDGLDECSDPASVLDALALGAENVSVRLRVLVTSRPYADVQWKFKNTPLYHLATQNHFHDINPNTLSKDVAAYLTTYTKYIDSALEDNPAAQLKRILSRKRGIGSSPLAELDALYDQVLDDLRQSLKTTHDLDVVRDIIETVILAQSKMSLTACSGLMHMELSDARSVLRRLTAVILLPEDENEAITPFHASFGEYIQDEARCTVRELAVDVMSAHGRIAERCIAIIASAARDGIVGVEYPSQDDIPLHLSYASLSLAAHVHISSYEPRGGDGDIFRRTGIWAWLNLLLVQVGLQQVDDDVRKAGFASLLHVEGLHTDTTTSVGRLMAAKHVVCQSWVTLGHYSRKWNVGSLTM